MQRVFDSSRLDDQLKIVSSWKLVAYLSRLIVK